MPREFVYQRRVQFAETDMAGVMHFANYYRLMEEAEHAFWRSLGLHGHMVGPRREFGWPRVATSCEDFGPARYEDVLEIRLRLTSVGEKTVEYETPFYRGDERLAAARAKAVCCTVRERAFEAMPIPEDIRRKLLAECAAQG